MMRASLDQGPRGIAKGIRPGNEVITIPINWISIAPAFAQLSAKLVFCAVDAYNRFAIHLLHGKPKSRLAFWLVV